MAGGTPREFRMTLANWAKQNKAAFERLARDTCQTIAMNVVKDTPVDTGFLRGSWQPSIGGASLAPTDATKAPTISAVVSGLKLGQTFSMRNNAVYALRIEFGFVGTDSLGRTYNQKGRYFVRRNIAKWPKIVAEAARKL